jgi:hypothetical protein
MNYELVIRNITVTIEAAEITIKGDGRLFQGKQDSHGLYSGTRRSGSSYGTFPDLFLSPNGDVLATGKVVTGDGTFPLQIRKN